MEPKKDWEIARDEKNATLDAFIETLGLTYSAVFVPQNVSRNAGEKHPSLNWIVIIGKGVPAGGVSPVVIRTDYMQGIGHLPESEATLFRAFGHSNSLARDEYNRRVANSGRYGLSNRKLPSPPLRDVLYSLVLDGDADDYTFEEWCSNYGLATDSRKAEQTYSQCRGIGAKLRRMLGAPNLARLRELFQDY